MMSVSPAIFRLRWAEKKGIDGLIIESATAKASVSSNGRANTKQIRNLSNTDGKVSGPLLENLTFCRGRNRASPWQQRTSKYSADVVTSRRDYGTVSVNC